MDRELVDGAEGKEYSEEVADSEMRKAAAKALERMKGAELPIEVSK